MITIDMQLKNGSLVPFSEKATELLENFKPNQIVKAKISGLKKERSTIQLRLFWACCRTVSLNTIDEHWDTPEKVCIQVKIALKFFKTIIVAPDGKIHFDLDSISFKNLGQVEANKIFSRSWPILANKIGVSVDKLLENAEND